MSEKRRIVWQKLAKWFGVFLLCVAASIGAVYIYLATQTGAAAIERQVLKRENSRPLVFAHRGGGGLIPENTLEAFVYSARMGVDVLELDVR
ncbi:MAG: hypothetical protein M3521_13785, partial [Acidobacteriota bacterium]|nr:hypothetical protein [Acidobacteriota bacterium]